MVGRILERCKEVNFINMIWYLESLCNNFLFLKINNFDKHFFISFDKYILLNNVSFTTKDTTIKIQISRLWDTLNIIKNKELISTQC